MKKLGIILLSTFLLTSCSLTKKKKTEINILETRANYDSELEVTDLLDDFSSNLIPNRTEPVQVDIFVHPHETIHGDYFRGGYIRSIVTGSRWELKPTLD